MGGRREMAPGVVGSGAGRTVSADPRPLIVHVMFSFDTGGLENGVVNLVNHLPRERYRHAIMALTRISGFRERVVRDDVEFIALGKKPGHALGLYPRIVGLLRELRPAIVHTRNLAALEVSAPAAIAGVPVRIHGEHGRDVGDLHGTRRRYQWVRRAYRPFVSHYVALSQDLERYLVERVGVGARHVSQIYNGVDVTRFVPVAARAAVPGSPFADSKLCVVGSVGRMQAVKAPVLLAQAFVEALALRPALRDRLRLAMVGDGPLRDEAMRTLEAAGMRDLAWLPGERSDVPALLQSLDVFVLPSLAEGISNTILEAMASGLPVVATRVGGNAELVRDGVTGMLVPPANPRALAEALIALAEGPARARAMGRAGRARALEAFSLDTMVSRYATLYDTLCERRRIPTMNGADAARRRHAAKA